MADATIAYFSMEIALERRMSTYSGGLGILAGDMIRSAADLKLPMIAVTLLHRMGHFSQRLDEAGRQSEEPQAWAVEDFLKELPQRASITIEQRTVTVRAWQYLARGLGGHTVPVLFLDTDLEGNAEWDRTLTHFLYGGDAWYRLCQEIVLGIGGVRILRALDYAHIERYHMNEGHASLLALELLEEETRKADRVSISSSDIEAVKEQCVFTTHTPVPAGHDQFPMDMAVRALGPREIFNMKELFGSDPVLNMTHLALNLSHYVNGVAKKHGETSQLMFRHYTIEAITNGVHAGTWVSPPFQALYDRYLPEWRQDSFSLRAALGIPRPAIWEAHLEAKRQLLEVVNRQTNAGMELDTLTLGFARRATPYKRADLLFQDVERLKRMVSDVGAIQVIYSGKAHPQDHGGKELIERVVRTSQALRAHLKVVYLVNYDMGLAKLMTGGADIWLNTPQPPLEASGTSGMKAALNGIPSLSVLDGWWIEGCLEGITGWAIGPFDRNGDTPPDAAQDAAALYGKLELVIPLFYRQRDRFIEIMRYAIALNGSFFNTHRMLNQYALNAYLR